MAEAIVSLAIERITDLLIYEAFFLKDVKEEVESLMAAMERMKSFLKDVDSKQDRDERLRTRVREIRDLAYDAENVIDSYILKVSHQGDFHGMMKRFTAIFTKPFHLHKIGKQIKAIQTKLGDISRSLPAYGISGEGDQGSSSAVEMQRRLRRSYPHVEEEDVVSLEGSTRDVMDQLMKEADEDRLRIVSIVGMGGIGKTTLAKRVYNHNDVKRHFDCCAWVFISHQCMPREVFHGVLVKVLSPSVKERELIDRLKEDELVEMLYDVLNEKRYLVVFDDVWRCEDWDSLKPAFPGANKGSRLLFTTRNMEVALFADPCSSPIELPLLTDDESWKLFTRKAFPENKMDTKACSEEFEVLGKEMLKKCGGLPLAIVVLGGLLATKKSLNEWEMVQKNIKAHLNNFQQQDYKYAGVNRILALSFNELPFHLKPCFLYLGHYPEDSEIPKKELIRLWIAEGFICPSLEEGEMWMEDVAEQYLGELTNRSLVQVGRRDHTVRGTKTCRVHDLLRDLCVSKAREENFFGIVVPPLMNENNNHSLHFPTAASKVRRVVVHPISSNTYVSLEGKCPKLRSLLLFQDEGCIRLNISKCNNFRFLRVLKLLRMDSRLCIPSEIGKLCHLRYLALQCVKVIILPQSIGNLKSLLTLCIRAEAPLKFPNAVFKLERLRHLILNFEGWQFFEGCGEVNSLKNVETLKYVKVKSLTQNNPLLKLTKIRTLGIEFRRPKDVAAFMRSPICGLGHLQSLHMKLSLHPYPNLEPLSQCHHLSNLLLFGKIREDPRSSHHVLEFLPKNIAKLTLRFTGIEQDSMAVLEKLPHLRTLRIQIGSYVGTKIYCTANGFPQLDFFNFGPTDVEDWHIEEGAMRRLRILNLFSMFYLRMIPEGLKHITSLQEMALHYPKKSLAKRIQVIDGYEGEDYDKVSHIPSIKIFHPIDG